MASLEGETEDALARRFPYRQRKRLAMASRELPPWRAVLGTNWARDKSLFDWALSAAEAQLADCLRDLL
jgi:hypothetical protein